MGWNCRHTFFPVIPGIDEPKYTKEELENIDPPPVEIKGKTYTYYEAEQRQRFIERSMRELRREIYAAQTSGDEQQYKARVNYLRLKTTQYIEFCKDAGLLPRPQRYGAIGVGRVVSKEAKWPTSIGNNALNSLRTAPKTAKKERPAVINVPGGTNGGTGKIYKGQKISRNSQQNISQNGLTNSGNGGIINNASVNFDQFGAIYEITDEAIQNVPYVEIQGFTKEQNVALQNMHRDILKAVQNKPVGTEAGIICTLDMETKSQILIGEDKARCVFIPSWSEPYISAHNHPSNLPLGYNDISNFLYDTNSIIKTVIGNKGAVYVLQKTDDYNAAGYGLYLDRLLVNTKIGDYSLYEIANNKNFDYKKANIDPEKGIELLLNCINDFLGKAEEYGFIYYHA